MFVDVVASSKYLSSTVLLNGKIKSIVGYSVSFTVVLVLCSNLKRIAFSFQIFFLVLTDLGCGSHINERGFSP